MERDYRSYHYGARYYDPQLGRWLQVDPALIRTANVLQLTAFSTKIIENTTDNKAGLLDKELAVRTSSVLAGPIVKPSIQNIGLSPNLNIPFEYLSTELITNAIDTSIEEVPVQ